MKYDLDSRNKLSEVGKCSLQLQQHLVDETFTKRQASLLLSILAGTPTSMIEKLVATCSVAARSLLKRSFQTADDVSAADACL